MVFVGILLTLGGFLLSVLSLAITSSTGGRLGLVIVGILLSLVGIIGFVNKAFMNNAIWKR